MKYSIMLVRDLSLDDAVVISAMFTGIVRKRSSFSEAWPYQTGNHKTLVSANEIANAIMAEIFK